jgi:aconitate hydratase
VLPYRSNIEALSRFTFSQLDEAFVERADAAGEGHGMLVAGGNYGQGSSREHAALAPRSLGVRVVLAESYARIHWQNLANFGILPLRFRDDGDRTSIHQGDVLAIEGIRERLRAGERTVPVVNRTRDTHLELTHDLSDSQIDAVLAGSVLASRRGRVASEGHRA